MRPICGKTPSSEKSLTLRKVFFRFLRSFRYGPLSLPLMPSGSISFPRCLLTAGAFWLSLALAAPAQAAAPIPATRPAPVLAEAPAAAPVRPAASAARTASALTAAAYGDSSYGLVVDPSKREQSRVFFQTVYQASQNVPSGWTGNVALGAPGATGPAFHDAVALRLDYFRALAGLPAAITLADAYGAKDQQAALMMSANRALSHTPPATWLWYTADGALAAASSNLNYGSNGPDAIDAYIQDSGATNAALGHRRWVLFPATTVMGTGDVDGTDAFQAANALWVMDPAAFTGTEPPARAGFVAWPPAGYVPYQVVFPRWSFSVPGGDVSAATVTMQRAGQPVSVRQEIYSGLYGDGTVVWVPDGQSTDFAAPSAPANGLDVTYAVTVANVLTAAGPSTFTYQVTVFDPAKAGTDTLLPALTGPTHLTVGTPGTYRFNAVPGATGYRWAAWPVTALTLLLDAENGAGASTAFPAGTDLLSSTASETGGACYQLNAAPATGAPGIVLPGATGESLTLDTSLLATAASVLQFNAKLGYNLTGERAAVQVSTDGGTTWQDVYTEAGTGVVESAFTAKSVGLGAFAGQMLRVRFVYSAALGQQYYPRFPDTGWFLDDITVTNARQVGKAQPTPVADGASQFDFSPAAESYALQVTPLFYGQYAADAGPLLFVDAAVGGGGTGGGGTTGTAPEVTVAASVPSVVAGAGTGVFTFTRTGDLSSEILVVYTVKGTAANGTDYVLLTGKKKLKAGKAGVKLYVTPLGAAAGGTTRRIIKLTLQPGTGYTVGAAATAKMKITW